MDYRGMDTIPLISDKENNISKTNGIVKNNSKDARIKFTNFNKRINMNKKKQKFPRRARGAIYIGHIPHGFYEDEMRAYFNQFGKVISTKVIRSKNTGRSRGFGFVEFEDEDVAKIAAETMNNYLMFNRVLKCRYIPPEERKGPIFERRIYPVLPKVKNRLLSYRNKKKAFMALDQKSYQKKAEEKVNNFKKFFEERGIDFSFKVNFADSADNKTHEFKNVESGSPISGDSESKDNTDEQFGVLEIDESDNEIQFKTPPRVKKIIKRSTCAASSDVIPNKMPRQVVKQSKKLKNSSASEMRKNKTPKKKISKHPDGKLKKNAKIRENPLEKSFTPKEAKSKKKEKRAGAMTMSRKKGKVKAKEKARK